MMNALIPAPAPLAYADLERLGASIARSGLFGIKTAEQAIALMMISQAEGRHPALAARDYDIIQGRPAKKAEAMLRDFLDAGGKVEWHELSDIMADATFSHPKGGTVRITWDMSRAAKAQLNGKDNYKKFPRQMLRSRTVSEGVRTVWPLATSGMYVPEEARDMPAEPPFQGTTIEHERPSPEAPSPPSPAPEAPPEGRYTDKWLKGVQLRLATVQTVDELAKVEAIPSVARAREDAPTLIREQIDDWFTDAYARVQGRPSPDDAADDMDSAAEPASPPSRTKTVPAGVGTDMNDAIPF